MRRRVVLTNELGHRVEIVVWWRGVEHGLVITMVGPNSTTTNEITLAEARALHQLLSDVIRDEDEMRVFKIDWPNIRRYVTRNGRIATLTARKSPRSGGFIGPAAPMPERPADPIYTGYLGPSGETEYRWTHDGRCYFPSDPGDGLDLVGAYDGEAPEYTPVFTDPMREGSRVTMELVVTRIFGQCVQLRVPGIENTGEITAKIVDLPEVCPPPTYAKGDVVRYAKFSQDNEVLYVNERSAVFSRPDGELFVVLLEELSIGGATIVGSAKKD